MMFQDGTLITVLKSQKYRMELKSTMPEEKAKPALKVYLKDKEGKIIKESEIALWEKTSKAGTVYYDGKDSKGSFYVGFKQKV